MRVTCPKCQFENQADSNRVVCARCATIIEVRPEAGVGGYDTYSTNFDDGSFGGGSGTSGSYENGGRRTVSYPAAGYGGGAADAGGYPGGNYPGSNYPTQNYSNASYPTAPVSHQSDQDVYATRIDDDFDDVLDIPRTTVQQPQSYQPNEAAPVFEDVFATPDYGMPNNQRSTPDQYQIGMGGMSGANDQYQPNDPYAVGGQQYRGNSTDPAFDNPSYGVPPEPEFMGWPVLPEDSTDPGLPTTSGFAKKNSLFRTVLIVAGALGLLFIAYSLFSGPVTTRKTPPKPADSETTSTATGSEQPKADESAKGDIAAVTNSDKTAGDKPPAGPSGVEPKPATTSSRSEKVVPPVTVITPGPKVLQPETTTVKKPEPAKPTENAGVPPTPNRGGITLQVGSFNDRTQADERVSRLKAAGIDARIVSANIPNRGTWHRVQVGRFVSREQAAGYASQLRGRGLVQDFMVTPVN